MDTIPRRFGVQTLDGSTYIYATATGCAPRLWLERRGDGAVPPAWSRDPQLPKQLSAAPVVGETLSIRLLADLPVFPAENRFTSAPVTAIIEVETVEAEGYVELIPDGEGRWSLDMDSGSEFIVDLRDTPWTITWLPATASERIRAGGVAIEVSDMAPARVGEPFGGYCAEMVVTEIRRLDA